MTDSRKLRLFHCRPNSMRRCLTFCALFIFLISSSAFSQIIPGRYTLVLQDPPVSAKFATREAQQTAAAVSYRREIETKQGAMKAELASRNIIVTGSVSVLGNFIFVSAPASRVDEMRA